MDPVQYRFTISSLLAQRLVAGSLFFERKEKHKREKNIKNWASYMPLSQPGMPSSSRPTHIMYLFFSFHIRSPAQLDVAGSIVSSFFVFCQKKSSQLDAIELERCVWASTVLLR